MDISLLPGSFMEASFTRTPSKVAARRGDSATQADGSVAYSTHSYFSPSGTTPSPDAVPAGAARPSRASFVRFADSPGEMPPFAPAAEPLSQPPVYVAAFLPPLPSTPGGGPMVLYSKPFAEWTYGDVRRLQDGLMRFDRTEAAFDELATDGPFLDEDGTLGLTDSPEMSIDEELGLEADYDFIRRFISDGPPPQTQTPSPLQPSATTSTDYSGPSASPAPRRAAQPSFSRSLAFSPSSPLPPHRGTMAQGPSSPPPIMIHRLPSVRRTSGGPASAFSPSGGSSSASTSSRAAGPNSTQPEIAPPPQRRQQQQQRSAASPFDLSAPSVALSVLSSLAEAHLSVDSPSESCHSGCGPDSLARGLSQFRPRHDPVPQRQHDSGDARPARYSNARGSDSNCPSSSNNASVDDRMASWRAAGAVDSEVSVSSLSLTSCHHSLPSINAVSSTAVFTRHHHQQQQQQQVLSGPEEYGGAATTAAAGAAMPAETSLNVSSLTAATSAVWEDSPPPQRPQLNASGNSSPGCDEGSGSTVGRCRARHYDPAGDMSDLTEAASEEAEASASGGPFFAHSEYRIGKGSEGDVSASPHGVSHSLQRSTSNINTGGTALTKATSNSKGSTATTTAPRRQWPVRESSSDCVQQLFFDDDYDLETATDDGGSSGRSERVVWSTGPLKAPPAAHAMPVALATRVLTASIVATKKSAGKPHPQSPELPQW